MGSTSVSSGVEPGEGIQPEDGKGTIRVIVADTQAIFRAGLRKIFALEDDIRVVGQAESLDQTIAAIQKFSADIVIFEAALAPNPADAVSDLLRQSASCRLVVVLQEPDQEMTLELFRRGAHGIVSREIEPEMLVECLRKVAQGEPGSTAARRVGDASLSHARPASGRVASQSFAHAQRVAHRLLRYAGDEEQRDCPAGWHHRAGGQELSPQGLRQAGSGRPSGTRTLLPESPRG
jgi:DNA-binding NarL/FixJ family response regulator